MARLDDYFEAVLSSIDDLIEAVEALTAELVLVKAEVAAVKARLPVSLQSGRLKLADGLL